MAKISVGESRPERPEETALRLWFEEQEKKSIDNLEAGARQIITLVSAFYGLIFGALAFGSDKLEPSLHFRPVLIPGTLAILAMLAAVVAALVVVLPLFGYRYNPHKPGNQKKVYESMRRLKVWGLRVALTGFCGGLIAFAWLIGTMLYYR